MAPEALATLQHVGPEVIEPLCALGHRALDRRSYSEAIELYSQALALADQPGNEGKLSASLLAGTYYRLGCAHQALSQWPDATRALQAAVRLAPEHAEAARALAGAQQRIAQEVAARRAQADTERRHLVFKLRAARREDQKLVMLNQCKQSMVGPDWELEELDWRPTFLPGMKLKPQKPEVVLADPKTAMLRDYLNALADLAHPKQALSILTDEPRLLAFQNGIASALEAQPGSHVLVLGAGSGILGMLAARSGAERVSAVERSRMLYRMAKQVLDANQEQLPTGVLELLPRQLQLVAVEGEPASPGAQIAAGRQPEKQQQGAGLPHGTAAEGAAVAAEPGSSSGGALYGEAVLPWRADVLVTDLLDHSVLGMGLLPSLDYAAQWLLTPGARVIPQSVQVFAMLLEVGIGEVSGFDLSTLNAYCWYPHHEAVDLSKAQHRRLSAPFAVNTLDLQARVAAVQGISPEAAAEEGEGRSKRLWEQDACIDVPVTADGHWNAVAFWFEAYTDSGTGFASYSLPGGNASGLPVGSTCQPAVQYLDGMPISKGARVQLRVRQDSGQYVFTSQPPQCRPRHAIVPRWHFDMVMDQQRNDAYDEALRKAVARKRAAGCSDVLALDIGAGSGILSMMAARAGADSVYAAEISQHMCDVGEEATIMNGFLGRVTMLDRDARRMDVLRKPDGTAPELPRRADLLVYEVFDSGCIGEGILHLLAAAQHKLLAADTTLVPMAARVYCQPIQMRVGSVLGFDLQQANRWRWRPDYEGVELGKCRDEWQPLADPLEVFAFDFRDAFQNMQPARTVVQPRFTREGVFNAVAMWFELQLDEDIMLSTSPYCDKGPTWQQAVQWVEEVEVAPGAALQLAAAHDSYSISYDLAGCNEPALLAQHRTAVPLRDPAWQATYEGLQGMNSQLVKACVQNPLEYRSVAMAALQLAARPHDLGVDTAQAVDFCVKMMG